MRVSREQFAQNRARIVEKAAALFREKGFDGIGVADIMKAAELTHGGFYGHFASKDDLEAQASQAAFTKSEAKWRKIVDAAPNAPLDALLDHYFSHNHFDRRGEGCILPALACDAARQGEPLRRTFRDGLESFFAVLTDILPGTHKARRRASLAALSQMVGAVVLARAVDDEALARDLLKANLRDLKRADRF